MLLGALMLSSFITVTAKSLNSSGTGHGFSVLHSFADAKLSLSTEHLYDFVPKNISNNNCAHALM